MYESDYRGDRRMITVVYAVDDVFHRKIKITDGDITMEKSYGRALDSASSRNWIVDAFLDWDVLYNETKYRNTKKGEEENVKSKM